MIPGGGHVSLYRHLVRLYPASFRQDFGDDLVVMFARQIADEPPARVWARTVRDLAVSVPLQRLEAHMKHPSSRVLTVVSGVVAATAALLAVTLGTGPAMPVFLLVALAAAGVGVWSWQAARPVRADGAATESWWKIFLAGPALAALTLLAMAAPWPEAIDLGDNAYWLIVISFMTSLALAATGLLMGIGAAVGRRRTGHAGASA